MLTYGSTMFFVQVLQSLAPHPKLWTTSGSPTSWVQDLVGGSRSNASSKRRAAVRPGADGLTGPSRPAQSHTDRTTRELYDGPYRSYCDLYPATKATTHYLAQLEEHEAMDALGLVP
jgi:hypothetical protein